jgi:LPS sulfotransferase NodH
MPRRAHASGQAGSYLICATPRTGSTLLCGLLESTGVAGHPESYFRHPDEGAWAARWGITSRAGDAFSYADYVPAAVAAGRTGNGVFAARIMWGTLEELTAKLATVYPHLDGADTALLDQAFGHTRFIYLRRNDVLAQAISWLRAEQTDVWWESDQAARREPARQPHFDADQIRDLIRLIGQHNRAWLEWFASVSIQPELVTYENLDADPVGVTLRVLDFLGLELPAGRQIRARHRRLADSLNAQWAERYRRYG